MLEEVFEDVLPGHCRSRVQSARDGAWNTPKHKLMWIISVVTILNYRV